MSRIADRMTSDPTRVPADTSIPVCAARMRDAGFRHLPVVDADERLVGLLTDTAVFGQGALTSSSSDAAWLYFDPEEQIHTAGDLARPARVVVAPDDRVSETLREMIARRESAALVVDGERLAGIFTEQDALQFGRSVVSRLLSTRLRSTRPLVTMDIEAPLADAWDEMLGKRIRHLVLTREGKLAGVVSFRDLAGAVGLQGWRTPLSALWTRRAPLYLKGDLSMQTAVGEMADHKIGCLPVVDDDMTPFGIVTRSDVMEILAEELEDIERAERKGGSGATDRHRPARPSAEPTEDTEQDRGPAPRQAAAGR